MIIRSQDKRIITTDMNLYIEPIDNKAIGNVACWIKNNEMGVLATYSLYEKAIKVLDMIQSAYNAIETMKIDKQAWRDNHYFEMPSDEEIEV